MQLGQRLLDARAARAVAFLKAWGGRGGQWLAQRTWLPRGRPGGAHPPSRYLRRTVQTFEILVF